MELLLILLFFVYAIVAFLLVALWSTDQGVKADGPVVNALFALVWPVLVVIGLIGAVFNKW